MSGIYKQVWVGVIVIILTSLLAGSYSAYSDISANTNHRLGSVIHEDKLDKLAETLIRIETNQKILLNKYESDINK